MMSDLHIGEVIGKKLVQSYVALSNAQHPDMVVLVGDIMDYESRFAEMEHIENDLQQLKAPLGVYVVNGNPRIPRQPFCQISLAGKNRSRTFDRLGRTTRFNLLPDRQRRLYQ